jgi:hypothetical protein
VILMLRVLKAMFVDWVNAGDDDEDDGVPERCVACRSRRPDDRLQWEHWEALHEECQPIGLEVPW